MLVLTALPPLHNSINIFSTTFLSLFFFIAKTHNSVHVKKAMAVSLVLYFFLFICLLHIDDDGDDDTNVAIASWLTD